MAKDSQLDPKEIRKQKSKGNSKRGNKNGAPKVGRRQKLPQPQQHTCRRNQQYLAAEHGAYQLPNGNPEKHRPNFYRTFFHINYLAK